MSDCEGRKAADEIEALWKDRNAGASERNVVVEHYPAGAKSEAALAQRLHDEGLIVAINERVLHPLGLALGVFGGEVDRDAMRMSGVRGLTLHEVRDDTIEYASDGAHERGREKLRAGYEALLASWDEPAAT